jgi:hypothetical protein
MLIYLLHERSGNVAGMTRRVLRTRAAGALGNPDHRIFLFPIFRQTVKLGYDLSGLRQKGSCKMLFVQIAAFVAGLTFPADDPQGSGAKPTTLHYLISVDGEYKPESDVTITKTDKGTTCVSKTVQDKVSTMLSSNYGPDGKLTSAAVAIEELPSGKSRAVTVLWHEGGTLEIKKKSGSDLMKVMGEPVVFTTPGSSDVVGLIGRYDLKKGGKQQFSGVWIHPAENCQTLKLTIEHVDDKETISVQGKKIALHRFVVRLRGGEHLVWMDSDGVVIKIVKNQLKSPAVVLDGYQEAAKGLGP